MSGVPPRVPDTHDTDVDPVLLPYQQAWIDDDSPLKISEKSRRTGLTWAEAADDVLIAAADGGSNVYYIGYNQDMAIEYIEACALWARAFHAAASEVDEGIWDDDDEKHIKTFTIRFPGSGRRIVALSSRPANLRGKQGVVVIDEAAFHDRLDELIKAAMALLIWGGKVRVISTHNGDSNPFNELIQEIRAGRRRGKVHRITFREAVEQGLYRRVCLRLGVEWTRAGEAAWVDEVYDYYGSHAAEELDVIPSQGTGRWLARALIEARMIDVPVLRLALDDAFTYWPEATRRAEVRDWCDRELKTLLAELPEDLWIAGGEDFGRASHMTVIAPFVVGQDLVRRQPFLVELANVPFEQQRQVLFYILDRVPRLQKVLLDKGGNGAYLAEVAAQTYGEAVEGVQFSEGWYREHMPKVKAAFEDGTIWVARDADVVDDLSAVRIHQGIAQVPKDTGQRGRHADAAIAIVLGYIASLAEPVVIEYHSAGRRPTRAVDQFAAAQAARDDAGWGGIRRRHDMTGF